MKGDWIKANDLLMNLKTFNHYTNVKEVKELLTENIKITSLKCYLIYYSYEFQSFNFTELCKKFNLEENLTRKIINNVNLFVDF